MTRRAPDAPASVYATALLAGFVRRGVTDVVVCPGSRSQALALAAARFEQAGLVRLHVRIDERSAGFLALGLAAFFFGGGPIIGIIALAGGVLTLAASVFTLARP